MSLEKPKRTNLEFDFLKNGEESQFIEWLFPWLWSGKRRVSIFCFIFRLTEPVIYRP